MSKVKRQVGESAELLSTQHFRDRIRLAIHEADQSQRQIAELIPGVDETMVSRWANEKNLPSTPYLLALALTVTRHGRHLNPTWLIRGEGNPWTAPAGIPDLLYRFASAITHSTLPEDELLDRLAVAVDMLDEDETPGRGEGSR